MVDSPGTITEAVPCVLRFLALTTAKPARLARPERAMQWAGECGRECRFPAPTRGASAPLCRHESRDPGLPSGEDHVGVPPARRDRERHWLPVQRTVDRCVPRWRAVARCVPSQTDR